jgi:hypothetical protein
MLVSYEGLVYTPTAAINTTGVQYRKVKLVVDLTIADQASRVVEEVAGATAASAVAAVAPDTPADHICLATLAIPISFTAGTTSFTLGMITETDVANLADMTALLTTKG